MNYLFPAILIFTFPTRVDPNVPIEETVGAMAELVKYVMSASLR